MKWLEEGKRPIGRGRQKPETSQQNNTDTKAINNRTDTRKTIVDTS